MPKIAQYNISSNNPRNNGPKPCQGSCRVKLNGVILAHVILAHSDPLTWMRRRPQDAMRKELVRQLQENNVSEADIAMILTLPEDKQGL